MKHARSRQLHPVDGAMSDASRATTGEHHRGLQAPDPERSATLGHRFGAAPIQRAAQPIQCSDSEDEDADFGGLDLFADVGGEQAAPQAQPRQPRQPPPKSATKLRGNRKVRRAIRKAWIRSMKRGHEHGGIIYQHEETGRIRVLHRTSHATHSTRLNKPDHLPGHTVVGNFHTHPNRDPNDLPQPSHADRDNAAKRQVPSFVFTYPNAHRHPGLQGVERDEDHPPTDGSLFAYGTGARDPKDRRRGYPFDPKGEDGRVSLHNLRLPGAKPVPTQVRPQREPEPVPTMKTKTGKTLVAARKVGGRRVARRRKP